MYSSITKLIHHLGILNILTKVWNIFTNKFSKPVDLVLISYLLNDYRHYMVSLPWRIWNFVTEKKQFLRNPFFSLKRMKNIQIRVMSLMNDPIEKKLVLEFLLFESHVLESFLIIQSFQNIITQSKLGQFTRSINGRLCCS